MGRNCSRCLISFNRSLVDSLKGAARMDLLPSVRRQNIWLRTGRRFEERQPRLGLILCGEFAVLQAPMFDGLSLDPFSLSDDRGSPAEVGVGGCHVAQALVIALVIVVLDEGRDLSFEIAGQEVVLEQDPVFQRLVPAFDLALGLRMERRSSHMAHALGFDVLRKFPGDVARR